MSMPVRKEGELLKWTNYLMGWQPRWFVLDGNVLSYCTSEAEVSQGCKGSVNVGDCEVNASSHDQCRFDIVVPGELCFYVRAKTKTERQEWLIALGTAKNQFCKALSIPSTTTPRSEDVSLCDLFIVEQVLGFRDEILCKKEIEPKDEVLLTACNNFLETVDAFSWYNASMNAEELKTIDGRTFTYKKLCLATGGRPKIIADHPNVIGIRDTESVEEFGTRLKNARRIVVVGNGGIATEIVGEISNVEIIWSVKHESISAAFVDAGAARFFLPHLNKKNIAAGPKKRLTYTHHGRHLCFLQK